MYTLDDIAFSLTAREIYAHLVNFHLRYYKLSNFSNHKYLLFLIFSALFIFFHDLKTSAVAQTITLNQDTLLRFKPTNESPYILAKKGDAIEAINNADNWVSLSYKGKKYYTQFDNIYKTHSGASEYLESASTDSTCDYAYPYSGSNIYFDRPLAKFRHSGPLGLLFGGHERFPC